MLGTVLMATMAVPCRGGRAGSPLWRAPGCIRGAAVPQAPTTREHHMCCERCSPLRNPDPPRSSLQHRSACRAPPGSLLASLPPALPPSRGVFQLLATVLSQKASAQDAAVGDGPAKAQDIPAGACCRPGCWEQEEPWPRRGLAVG